MRYKFIGFREQGAGSREQGAGSREQGAGSIEYRSRKREEVKNNVYLIATINACNFIISTRTAVPDSRLPTPYSPLPITLTIGIVK
ncbi:hypothetical protein BJP36_37240 [Moorena producens JHB]|uniref:Uncharacterized protein n=1 Tax=Moorena producens (strain JHB) TaxID=1454205 RepID=A0A9Q9UWB5_MOOP1|nr:hypothetical protein [Moorena producens]WAN69740.1 hypothetical protein BJP36_37240 [Moorena producens JHB]